MTESETSKILMLEADRGDVITDEVLSLLFETGKRLGVVVAFAAASQQIWGEVSGAGVGAIGFLLLLWGVITKVRLIHHQFRRPVRWSWALGIIFLNCVLIYVGGRFMIAILTHLAGIRT